MKEPTQTRNQPPSPPRLTVEIPDEAYWKRLIKCQDACPVHTDARGYVQAIAEGEHERAYLIARGPNPLASICGRICGAPCEVSCRRGAVDAPIAIRALKRFVVERFGQANQVEGQQPVPNKARQPATPNAEVDEVAHLLAAREAESLPLGERRRVAIIGSGPAGLACGHDLALMGLTPVIFEMEPVPAGMLYLGVPAYRLPRELIRAEVAVIESLGVEIRCGVHVGKDVSFDELRRDFDAVVIATGAKRSRWLNLPGSDAKGILGGVDFLRAVSLGQPVEVGKRVIVIGGGNVAFDVGRTVLRQEQMDVSRQALRRGARDVRLCSLESLEEMPADDIEIIEADEEGVIRDNSLGPLEFLKDSKGHVTGVVFQKVLSVYDDQKRFAPVFDPSERTTLEADTVLLSVGQAPDLSFLDVVGDGFEMDGRGWLKCDAEDLTTGVEGVFVAGDLAHGTKLLIHAVASGKKAARHIYRYLTGKAITTRTSQAHFSLDPYRREEGYEGIERRRIPTEDVQARLKDPKRSVEKAYGESTASTEASRCLRCNINTIFDGARCILCGGCADVCPQRCFKLAPLKALDLTPDQQAVATRSLGEDWQTHTAIIKDEEACIRCGLCAERCPTNAITMERMEFSEAWS
jgi:formate dehydrogenase beta subunit